MDSSLRKLFPHAEGFPDGPELFPDIEEHGDPPNIFFGKTTDYELP